MTLSPVKSPLLLPEILVNIGRFLAKRELIACFQVCSTWHAALEPVLWADLNFEKQLLQSYFVDAERQVRILPDPPTIQRLARHITSIRYRGCQSPISLLILPHIVRLTRLRVFHHSSATLRSLILRNAATLVHIHWEEQYSELASVYRPPDLVDDMFSVMVQCQHLRTLTLTRSTVSESQAQPFYQLLQQLHSITLSSTNIHSFPSDPIHFPNIDSLALLGVDMDPKQQFKLVASCPNLATFSWKARARTPITADALALPTTCPRLTALDLSRCESSDSIMAQIMQKSPHLTFLDASRSSFGPACFKILVRNQSRALQHLDVRTCWDVTPEMIHAIMVYCQRLVSFQASDIPARVLIQEPQIQCLQLEILTLNLTEIAQDKTIQFRVYEQLARLTRLKILTFGPAAENSRIGAGAGIAAGGGGGGAAPRTWMGIGMGVGTGTNAAAGVGAAGNAGGGGGGGAAVAGARRLQHAIGSTPLNNMMTTLKKDEPDSMDFRLKYGLAQLATLKQLEEFRFEGLVLCKMDVDEIQWIANAWKSLRMVRGVLHKEKRRRARLESKLRELRPDVRLVSIDMCKVTLF
ncbi:hypothetical protein BGZ91_011120 [Linnemannia elongata]|uniref:RNI-like protein n=1 Tax=Linnemannia elongata AG-77 TaxID=1314771 RepID=A0A197K449_9FUNG|nr:hypothetical protein BGZ91_011120 [Linnemannia elongata]OAQ31963.1 RNI-like protein [Linnemannia elongata AG-77]